jgi:hypothetical protein
MNKVRKLTPSTLKRIIAEEKLKLKRRSLRSSNKTKISNQQLIESYLKVLKLLKKKKSKSVNDVKKLEEARKLIKSKLLKRL